LVDLEGAEAEESIEIVSIVFENKIKAMFVRNKDSRSDKQCHRAVGFCAEIVENINLALRKGWNLVWLIRGFAPKSDTLDGHNRAIRVGPRFKNRTKPSRPDFADDFIVREVVGWNSGHAEWQRVNREVGGHCVEISESNGPFDLGLRIHNGKKN
jgi:hypothetical protein